MHWRIVFKRELNPVELRTKGHTLGDLTISKYHDLVLGKHKLCHFILTSSSAWNGSFRKQHFNTNFITVTYGSQITWLCLSKVAWDSTLRWMKKWAFLFIFNCCPTCQCFSCLLHCYGSLQHLASFPMLLRPFIYTQGKRVIITLLKTRLLFLHECVCVCVLCTWYCALGFLLTAQGSICIPSGERDRTQVSPIQSKHLLGCTTSLAWLASFLSNTETEKHSPLVNHSGLTY